MYVCRQGVSSAPICCGYELEGLWEMKQGDGYAESLNYLP